MRNELEQISTIEKYLNNELSAEDRLAFETNMSSDVQLQESVALQREIMQGITNLSLKQKIQRAQKKYYRIRNFTKWGLVAIIIIAAVVALLLSQGRNSDQPKTNESSALHQQQAENTDTRISPQKFLINTGTDTIVETRSGMVIQVPANGFLTANNQLVTGQVELIIKEAIDAASIMRAGLSSTSGDQLLESAGMFQVDARQNGNRLSINPKFGLYIELPTDSLRPGMKLFKGKRLADGKIDWVDPQPLKHDLTTVDIKLLNFYPPRYLDSLAKWGYNTKDKKFTDSLYYSFADWFLQGEMKQVQYQDTLGEGGAYNTIEQCAINPAKIKTIWSNHFQNTILATREFEERLSWIHKTGKNAVLDLYVNNLHKKLSEIDAMAAKKVPAEYQKQFLAFAARQDGTVKTSSVETKKLSQYYETKTRIFMDAVAKTNRAFWEKQAQLDEVATNKQKTHTDDSLKRTKRLFREELKLNLKSAYQQLGYDTSITPRLPDTRVYKIEIVDTGWYNVDRYVYESTTTRTTLNYTDANTGKTATIKYQPVAVQINNAAQFDDLYVYLLPDKLYSFMRMKKEDGKYTEQLNELIKYKLVCVGYKGERAFYYSQQVIEPKNYTNITLTETSTQELNRKLNEEGNGSKGSDIQKDIAFYLFYTKDKKRQEHNLALYQLSWKVQRVIWYYTGKGTPCCCFGVPAK